MSKDVTLQTVHEAVNDMRKSVDLTVGEYKEKMEKIQPVLDAYEVKNQEIVQKMIVTEKKNKEMSERIEDMEKSFYRLRQSGSLNEKSDETKAFEDFIVKGFNGVGPDRLKYLRTDVQFQGGYLAPTERVQDIIKKITEISPVRQYAKVRPTNSKSITIPKRQTLPNAEWIGEGGTSNASNSTYGQEEIACNTLRANVEVTIEMLNDSAFNIESEIMSDVVEQFAKAEGLAFVSGDGNNKPRGLITNSGIQTVPSGNASQLTPDSLITVTGELKTGYNPYYMFNRRTLAYIRNFKGTTGYYLWTPTLAEGEPARINGEPYILAIDMPDIAASATPVLYGDIMQGYTIADGQQMRVVRDEFSLAQDGKVRFLFFKRTGGQVVLSEALKLIVIAAS